MLEGHEGGVKHLDGGLGPVGMDLNGCSPEAIAAICVQYATFAHFLAFDRFSI